MRTLLFHNFYFMQLNTRPYLVILCSVLFLFLLFACLRSLFPEKQFTAWTTKNEAVMKGIVFSLFLIFSAAAVPVILKSFVKMQIRIGNGEQPMIKFYSLHMMKVVYAIWVLIGLSLAIALPAMIKDGFLSNTK